MRANALLLALLLIPLAAPAKADPAPADAPEHWTDAVEVSPGTFSGTGGGRGDMADWFRIATVPGHAVHTRLTAYADEGTVVGLSLRDAAGNLHHSTVASALDGEGTATFTYAIAGEIRIGLVFDQPVAYTLSLMHVKAPDLAVQEFRVTSEPVNQDLPVAVDPIHVGLQRRFEVLVKNEGTADGEGLAVIYVTSRVDPRLRVLLSTPIPRLAPGESATVSITATLVGAGDVEYFARTSATSDADLGNNLASARHYLVAGGFGYGAAAPVALPTSPSA